MRGKQEIECQGALFAPDGGFRVSLKGTERQRERDRQTETIIKQKKRGMKREERVRVEEDVRVIKCIENTDTKERRGGGGLCEESTVTDALL